ncbi:MAG: TonB-dependent receptor [Pseudomonadota bacterium]
MSSIIHRPFLAIFSLLGLALALASPATVAQSAERRYEFDIPAQPLGTALERFSQVTRRQVAASSSDIVDMISVSTSGTMSALSALQQMTSNSGLVVVLINGTDFAVRPNDTPPSTDNNTPGVMEEIVVYGENIQRRLLDTNTSINVQTLEDITRSNDKRIADVLARVANVSANISGLQASSFSVRGISSSGVGGAGNAQVASLTVDGAAFTSQQLGRGFNSLFDVEQIELMRGPQSTSQARNSLAGGIVVSTRDPEFEQHTQATASYGDYGIHELAVANTGAITEQFAYRIALQRLGSDGFIDNPITGDDHNFNETDTVRAKLLYRSKALPLTILLGHTHVEAEARNDFGHWFPDVRQGDNFNPFSQGGMDTEQDVTTLDITYQVSDRWLVTWQTAHNDFVSEDLNSNYATSLPDRNQAWFATADQDELNHTLRLSYEGDRVRGSFGLFTSDETNRVLRDGVADQNLFGSGLDGDAEINSPLSTDTQAIFGEFDIKLSDAWTLTLGARFEQVDIDSVSSTVANLVLPPPAPYTVVVADLINTRLDASTDFNEFLPKLGLTYALDEDQRIGFTYSEGYRQGGITGNITTLSTSEFGPEFVENYEFSYKSAFANGWTLNANVFYLDWQDQQVLDTLPGNPLPETLNAGESRAFGAELEAAWRTDVWDTYASLGYVDTQYDEFVSSESDFSGNEFPNSPSVTLGAGAFYTYGNWTVGAEASYRDGFYTAANNNVETNSLTLVDLSLEYAFKTVSVRGFVNNVFDEVEQVNEVFVIEGIPIALFSDPRTIGLQILYQL